ncbi:TPA: hypothetical protein L5U90_003225 [Pseudomonas aeruginosa]|nr:hypothetical protein [Pseudomonas aeruginosa]
MLPSHLLRMVNLCVSGDYADAGVRDRIKNQCIPTLRQHRRDVLEGSFTGRHSRPVGFIRKMIEDSKLIRRTLNHTHQQLIEAEPRHNVFSFEAAARRRAQASAYTIKENKA